MDLPQPLGPEQLYRSFDVESLPFTTTAELEDGLEIIGQQRAIDAIRFGIGIRHHGYNLFALGPNGVGRRTTANRFLTERAVNEPVPDDWCYVYNFEHPHKPRAHRLPPGRAIVFRDDMKKLAEELFSVLQATFTGEEYQLQKRALEEELRGTHTEALDKLREDAQTRGIALMQTPGGFAFAPLKEGGEVITPDEFMRLDQEAQKKIENEVGELQEALQRIMQQIPNLHREMQSKLKELNERVVEFTITPLMDELRQKYIDLESIIGYLDAVRKDVIKNFELFTHDEEGDGRQFIGAIMGMATPDRKAPMTRYEVNVVVDNSQVHGAPVIFLDQPRYQNLVGRVEHVAQMGALVTDFSLIKPGALHQANGGYLLIDALKLLSEPFAWEGLKRAIREGEISIESLGQVYSMVSTVSLEPEPIPLSVKVVLIGERFLYYLLSSNDPEFNELFKVSADFEDEVGRSVESAQAYARVIAEVARAEKLRHFDRHAVGRIIEHGSRLADDTEKLSTHMQSMTDVLREADYWAGEMGHDSVMRDDVQKAIDMQTIRASRVHKRILEGILRDQVLVETQGEVVGQVNGLSVYSLGNYSFGSPSRITARVRLGNGKVIDIEREVNMGGPIHSKGVLILAGFLGERYAADRPLSLTATLVFEQSYGGIEGDSASSAELYALLSALSGLPVKQSLAVTGSVDQRGQVQAIGGVNEKIEGYFDVCRSRGLTGNQGVLIPASNVINLMLRQDVVDAVRDGNFHIYPVKTIDEGIALLTGVSAGEADESAAFAPDSVNGRVVARLMHFTEKQRQFGEGQRREDDSERPRPNDSETTGDKPTTK
ncbi:MAG: ATP-dependent protease [Anaerolineae bacterium]|nr:MAG: ATP-dependent protease [Anaerolineae bacterium]